MSQFIEMFGTIDTPHYDTVTLTTISENLDSMRIPIKSGNRVDGQYPYCGASGIVDYVGDYIFDDDILLISEDGANLKDRVTPIAFSSSGKVWVNNHAHVLRFKDANLQRYVECYFNYNRIDKYLTGTAQPKLNQDKLKSIPIPLPSGEVLTKFISIYNQADKSGFDECKSQFIEMFGTVKSTKPLTDFIDVSFPGEWGQEDKDGSGVKVIRTTNFTNNGKLDLSDVVTRDIDSVKVEKKKLSKGDIILERSGGTNENPVGRVVYFEEDGVYLFNNFTQLLRCKEGVNSLFIFYSLFNYYQMNKNVIRSMGNKTTGIQNLKMDRYWQIPIADVSIELQKEFESIYRQADKSGSELHKSMEAIGTVKKVL